LLEISFAISLRTNHLRAYIVLSSIIYDILATMAEDWNECASIHSKQPMINKAILSHRFSKCSIGAYSIMVLLFGIGNMIAQRSANSELLVREKQLIVKMKLPPECTMSPIFEIVMVMQALLQLMLALIAGMLNAFIVTLVSWFRKRVFSRKSKKETQLQFYMIIILLIPYLNFVLNNINVAFIIMLY